MPSSTSSDSDSARLEGLLRGLLRDCPLDEWEAGKVVGDLGEEAIADMRLSEDRLSLVLSLPSSLSRVAAALEGRLREHLEPHLGGRSLALVLTSLKETAAASSAPPRSSPRSSPPPPSPREKGMSGVKIVLGVASGKGGVGKSTLAVNLAIALAQTPRANGGDDGGDDGGDGFEKKLRVGLLDGDLYGPSLVTMLGLDQPPRRNAEGLLIPEERFGIKTLSMGSMLDPKQALVWRGPLIARALKQMLDGSDWGELDLLLLDMPPGTGDLPLSLAQSAHLDCALLVATPQQVALYDVQKSLAMFVKLRIDIVGIVENMSYFLCPQCGHESHLFGHGGTARLAREHDIPLLGCLPLSQALQESADNATPFMTLSQDHAQDHAQQGTQTRATSRPKAHKQKSDTKPLSVLEEAQSLQAEEIRATLRSIAKSVSDKISTRG